MSKFHINPNTGKAARCTASVRTCKYGGESGVENHYETAEEARQAFEKSNNDKLFTNHNKSNNSHVPTMSLDTRRANLEKAFREQIPNVDMIKNANNDKFANSRSTSHLSLRKDEQVVLKTKAGVYIHPNDLEKMEKFADDNGLKMRVLHRGYDFDSKQEIAFTAIVPRDKNDVYQDMLKDLDKSKANAKNPRLKDAITEDNFNEKKADMLKDISENYPDVNFMSNKNVEPGRNQVLFKTPEKSSKGRPLTEDEAKSFAKKHGLKYERGIKQQTLYGPVYNDSYKFSATIHRNQDKVIAEKEAKIAEFKKDNNIS